jgi:hypothetical protein
MVTFFFIQKRHYFRFYIDGIECINDLFIDGILLIPQETISIKFKFIRKNVVYRIDHNQWRIQGGGKWAIAHFI